MNSRLKSAPALPIAPEPRFTTAVPLDDALRRIITEKAEADLDTNVVLRESVDKSILGGIIMSTNGKRIDASVASQLDHARNVLKTTTDGGEC